jgi:hypothetical protein
VCLPAEWLGWDGRKYFRQRRLGASLFFAKGGRDTSHAGKFVTSIARQLTSNIPLLQSSICEAITECNDIASQSLRDQWRQLVLTPLSKLCRRKFKFTNQQQAVGADLGRLPRNFETGTNSRIPMRRRVAVARSDFLSITHAITAMRR